MSVPAGAPAVISRAIAAGSSLRGLSFVTHARSAPRGGRRAHHRALHAVAIAAAAEHEQHAARGVLAHRRERARSASGRVRVVHRDHGRAGTARTRSSRPGTEIALGEPARDRARRRSRARARAANAPAAFHAL